MAIVPIKLGERPKTFARVIDFTGIDGSEYKLPVIFKYRTRSELIAWVEAAANIAIKAAEAGNAEPLETLLTVLQAPFVERPEWAGYAGEAPAWGRCLSISCSS